MFQVKNLCEIIMREFKGKRSTLLDRRGATCTAVCLASAAWVNVSSWICGTLIRRNALSVFYSVVCRDTSCVAPIVLFMADLQVLKPILWGQRMQSKYCFRSYCTVIFACTDGRQSLSPGVLLQTTNTSHAINEPC